MDQLAVKVKDCAVEGHEAGHSVFLAPTLSLDGGIAAEQDFLEANKSGDDKLLVRLWLKTFVTHGAVGWDLHDEEGNDLPFSVEAVLADWTIARPVADRASELYSDSVVAPLTNEPARRSPTGRTERSTSSRSSRTRSRSRR